MNILRLLSRITLLFFFLISFAHSQSFIKITDMSNPIVSAPGVAAGSYSGASWIDYNADGRLDLFWNRGANIYTGNPGNIFSVFEDAILNQGNSFGNSWADYDNDGDIDCFISGAFNRGSFLYRNDGASGFTKITDGVIGDSIFNKAWGCSWGDYNNDGYVDLILAAAYNFAGINTPNRFYHNNGDGTFTRIDTTEITAVLAPFTIPTWYDYDLDGDIDLFIGSGPANNVGARDYLFHNYLKETGTPYFQRIDTGSIGTGIVDGQVWNWIDYDNDGDLDAFLTNYSNSFPNNLYRNEGNYYFVKMTSAQVGSIVSDLGLFLSNIWQDFDNDGDLDCIVTRDASQSCYYYNNNGDGTFTRIDTTQLVTMSGGNFGATAGDYDKDGDQDVFIAGPTSTKGLFRNDLNNGNSWVNITCKGTGGTSGSNFSAIGTIVRAKANINGNPVWQIRQVSAQNSFNCQNALNVHFGFGNAVIIDSLEIRWTGSIKDVYTNVTVNTFYDAIEGQSLGPVSIQNPGSSIPEEYKLFQNYPNPFNPVTIIGYRLPVVSNVKLTVYDIAGRETAVLVNGKQNAGNYSVEFDATGLASGIYFYKIVTDDFISTRKMLLVK